MIKDNDISSHNPRPLYVVKQKGKVNSGGLKQAIARTSDSTEPKKKKIAADIKKVIVQDVIEPDLANAPISRKVAQQILDKAIEVGKRLDEAGNDYRRCIYDVIFHKIHEALGMKQSTVISVIRDSSHLGRTSFDNYKNVANIEIKFRLEQGVFDIVDLLKVKKLKGKEQVKEVFELQKDRAYGCGDYEELVFANPDFIYPMYISEFKKNGIYPSAEEMHKHIVEMSERQVQAKRDGSKYIPDYYHDHDHDDDDDKDDSKTSKTTKSDRDLKEDFLNLNCTPKVELEYQKYLYKQVVEANNNGSLTRKPNNVDREEFYDLDSDITQEALKHLDDRNKSYTPDQMRRLFDFFVAVRTDDLMLDALVVLIYLNGQTRNKYLAWLYSKTIYLENQTDSKT